MSWYAACKRQIHLPVMDASDPFACIKITKIHKQDSTRYINHESLYDKTNAEDSGDIQMEAKGLTY